VQARWIDESAITTLPHIRKEDLHLFPAQSMALPKLCSITCDNYNRLAKILHGGQYRVDQINEIHQVIKGMPIIAVDLMLESHWDANVEKKRITRYDDSVAVQRNEEYTLTIGLKRMNHSKTLKAHCPMFLKGKDESWFLVLGDIQNRELWALKRISGINSQQRYHQLQFTAPNSLGLTKLTFYLISDCYMGLDQQYNICLDVMG